MAGVPVVRRRYRLTVPERITRDGSILVPLDEERAREQVRTLKEAGVEAVCVCFLFSFLNPEHERRVAEIVREEFPEAFLSVSSEVIPQYREYERFSTVGLNAYVGPKVASYVAQPREGARGARCPLGAPPDDLRVGRRDVRGRDRAAREPAHVGAGRRRRRRDLGREAGRLRQRHHARRRRHLGRHRPRPGRPPADEAPPRHEGRPVPGDDPDGRRRHDRRRRRLDRLRRRGRHLPRRPALGRRRAGPGRVRARRHRGDRDRRDGQPRLAPPRGVPRRRDVARPREGARGVRRRPGRGARDERRGGVDGRGADPLALDGAVDRGELGAEGLRPARLRARRRGRRRPALRRPDRDRGRHAARRRAAVPGICAAMGLVATDMVYEYAATTYQKLSTLDAASLQSRFEELEAQASEQLAADGVPRPTASSSSGSSRPGTSARGTSSGSTSARGRSTTRGSRSSAPTSTTSTSASTRGASRTRTSRCRTSASAGSA